jgi:hypothetical protein
MKLQLTPQAEQELAAINQRIDEAGDEGYDDMCGSLNRREQLITDAGMYTDGAYEENEFDNLNEWCISVGNAEYQQTYLNTHPNAVREKIDMMLREGIITIVE